MNVPATSSRKPESEGCSGLCDRCARQSLVLPLVSTEVQSDTDGVGLHATPPARLADDETRTGDEEPETRHTSWPPCLRDLDVHLHHIWKEVERLNSGIDKVMESIDVALDNSNN